MIRPAVARRLRGDAGTTVIELVIASGIFLIILIAVLNVLDSGTRTERAGQARHDAILALRGSMTRLAKEVRQAISVDTSSTQTRLAVRTLISGVERDVVYEVTGNELTRTVLPSGAAMTMASNVTSTSRFCYDPPTCSAVNPPANPTTIRVTVALEPEVFSGGPIAMATEIEFRNVTN